MSNLAGVLGYAGKRVVVSGCASGIGQATAQLMLDLGAEVHGLDCKSNDLSLASFTVTDLASPASIENAVAQIAGRVDALFNCAGLAPTRLPLEVLKVNFLGTRYFTNACLERWAKAGGAIVSTSSNGGMGWQKHLPELLELLGHNEICRRARLAGAAPARDQQRL